MSRAMLGKPLWRVAGKSSFVAEPMFASLFNKLTTLHDVASTFTLEITLLSFISSGETGITTY
jgi:hypothetical protein